MCRQHPVVRACRRNYPINHRVAADNNISKRMNGNADQLQTLMELAARGDNTAFDTLALAVQDGIYRFALSRGLSRHDAADATQETLMRAFRARRNWRAGNSVTSWLFGIAMNVVREILRRRQRRPVEGLDLEHLISHGDHQRDSLEQKERRQALAKALAALPPRQQEAVACRYLMDMTLKETADVMGCAEGTVKAAVFAALENMKKMMKA